MSDRVEIWMGEQGESVTLGFGLVLKIGKKVSPGYRGWCRGILDFHFRKQRARRLGI